MKYQSPFSLGQLVAKKSHQTTTDEPRKLEIIEIFFDIDGKALFICEDITSLNVRHYKEEQIYTIDAPISTEFESDCGLKEIVIRESHRNGEMVQERMMEVIGVCFSGKSDAAYLCEDTDNGHRQFYTDSMLVGDEDFDQEKGEYPITPEETEDTNARG